MVRIKLWHRVFALTALATLLAVAAMLLVQQRAFQRGLLDYVNQIDRHWLPYIGTTTAGRACVVIASAFTS
jgi:hypothetical protein